MLAYPHNVKDWCLGVASHLPYVLYLGVTGKHFVCPAVDVAPQVGVLIVLTSIGFFVGKLVMCSVLGYTCLEVVVLSLQVSCGRV